MLEALRGLIRTHPSNLLPLAFTLVIFGVWLLLVLRRAAQRLSGSTRTALATAATRLEAERLRQLRAAPTAAPAADVAARPAMRSRAPRMPAPAIVPMLPPVQRGSALRRFGRDAVIAAEVLGPPLALREPGTIGPRGA